MNLVVEGQYNHESFQELKKSSTVALTGKVPQEVQVSHEVNGLLERNKPMVTIIILLHVCL